MTKPKLKQLTVQGHPFFVRPGSSDEAVLREVVYQRCYRRASAGFDVEAGEHWLDLGANVGAFALYAHLRGARVTCYEPDPDCFAILQLNCPWATLYNEAVTASDAPTLEFFEAKAEGMHSRGTALKTRSNLRALPRPVWNRSAKGLGKFDGIKADIEGSEGPILDAGIMPNSNKLVMEYHTSVDKNVENMRRRMRSLERAFNHVHYPPEFKRIMESDAVEFKSFFDRNVWAWN